jgi:hypothetical protein
MDKHERGLEVSEARLDLPLPKWNGSYRGEKHRLPKVVQKLLLGRPLTPEEKAELLWRFHELENQRRVRQRAVTAVVLVIGVLVALAAVAAYPPPWLRQQMSGVVGSVLQ